MKIDIDQHNNLRLREVFSGVLMETTEGNQIGVCMRDDTLEINVCPGSKNTDNWWRARMQAGRIGEDDFCAQSHSLTRDAFLRPLAAKQRELECGGVYMGLRSDESKARNVHLRSRGELYQIVCGEWRCCPLARWTGEDVFAYLTAHKVEINPCYFNNRFLPPEEIRVSWAIPTPSSLVHGDMEHYRHYYPQQFRRMREMGVC